MTSPMRTSPPVRPGLSVKLVLGLAAIGLIRPLMRISGFDLPGGQWVLTGSLQGPVALPIAIIPILVINTIWGAGAGLLALAVQYLRPAGR
ncbi:hypothetical protein [Arthrobacter sp. zg-Y895]|uniref:hypothetical protein n=1 Tax=Arthrobacter sp. zg-Y895 TaxID=2886933 RepID=UPI001D133690|nr:hypothetical protein [Arthrobacter sp. zg-Y895]MCC3301607.1 hypothetical protein [Arthrobacter sp. zg-Y895]